MTSKLYDWCLDYWKQNQIYAFSISYCRKFIQSQHISTTKIDSKVGNFDIQYQKFLYQMVYTNVLYNIIHMVNKKYHLPILDRYIQPDYSIINKKKNLTYKQNIKKFFYTFVHKFYQKAKWKREMMDISQKFHFCFDFSQLIPYISRFITTYDYYYNDQYIQDYFVLISKLIHTHANHTPNYYHYPSFFRYHIDHFLLEYLILKRYYHLMLRIYNKYCHKLTDSTSYNVIRQYEQIYIDLLHLELYFTNIIFYSKNPDEYKEYTENDPILTFLLTRRKRMELETSLTTHHHVIEEPSKTFTDILIEYFLLHDENEEETKKDIHMAILGNNDYHAELYEQDKKTGFLLIQQNNNSPYDRKYAHLNMLLQPENLPLHYLCNISIDNFCNLSLQANITKLIHEYYYIKPTIFI